MAREDVGAIDVKEHYAFVAVRRAKVKQLLNLIQGEKIKGMKTIIEEAEVEKNFFFINIHFYLISLSLYNLLIS